ASEEEEAKRYEEGGRGDFDIRVASQAPGVWVDKAAPKGKGRQGGAATGKKEGAEQGEGEEEVDERTFFQK
ncbi:MAG: hypothetical protein Q9225_004310, partial [Loekoesia sp. 1 TL-2023]